MSGGIKGITVAIGGDTSKLAKSLTAVSAQGRDLQRELKGVNTLLKFDPKNTTLLSQKQELLNQSVDSTKRKLGELKAVQSKVDSGEIKMTAEQYRNLEREIASTEQALKKLTAE